MLDIVGLLQTEKNAFTRSERALTEIVLADVDGVLKMSIVDLAANADVSPPTVTRFCRRLGCDSYADFKVRLAQSRFVGQRYFALTAGPSSVHDISQGVVNGIQSIIYETFEHLDFAAVERAAESIVKSSFVLSFGSGGASHSDERHAEDGARVDRHLRCRFRAGLCVADGNRRRSSSGRAGSLISAGTPPA